ncbi:MAG TPA: class I SAM-dependent methyltransferase [Solirubrobacterales bacterium]|nr:class I SAM-dependent methyltransferase [Solirubrobacterales bacterium]
MPEGDSAEFDRYSDSYREAVEDAIGGFTSAGLDFFTAAKADGLLELAERRVGPPGELAFLDVGCGPGETDGFLEGRVGRLAGVDIAPRMLESARRRNPWVDYRGFAPGEQIPFEDETFDVCFAVCVLHHVLRGERVPLISEVKRVCKPGGLVVLFEHNPFNPLTRRAVHGCEFDRDAELFTRRSASRILREAGLPDPDGRYILFFTRESALLRGIERRLGWLPLGAQYAVFAQRP